MTQPFTLVGLDNVIFRVDAMQRALTFQTEVPGYSDPAPGMGQLWCGAALIVLWDITDPGANAAIPPVSGGRNVDHLCIATSRFDPEAMRTHLAAHGVAIEREATHGGARGMGQSFDIRDPFGNKPEIKRPAEYKGGRG